MRMAAAIPLDRSLLRNRLFTRSTKLLPATGIPSWISWPRAIQEISHFRCSIKRLALVCMVLGSVSETSASIPLPGAPTAPSSPASAPAPNSFTATTRTGSLTCLSDKTLYRCNSCLYNVTLVLSSRSFLSRMVIISLSRACTFFPKVSVGGGVVVVIEGCPTVAGPPRPSCVRVPCLYLLSSTSRRLSPSLRKQDLLR